MTEERLKEMEAVQCSHWEVELIAEVRRYKAMAAWWKRTSMALALRAAGPVEVVNLTMRDKELDEVQP